MSLTDRYTRLLLGTLTLGAVLAPATIATAEPPGGPGDKTTPTTIPCELVGCVPPEPDPECSPWAANCDELTDDPCDPVEESCGGGGEPEPDPDPEEPVDPALPADPNFTG